MHAKTDSEVTSLAASSPTRSPTRQPVYYVQSPSHDGEKTTTSFHSTPVLSPSHSHSSSTRFSGSRKITPSDAGAGKKGGAKKDRNCHVIEEEGLLYDDDDRKFMSRRCYVIAFILGFFVLFSLFSLILWGAARPQKPVITVKVSQYFVDFIYMSFCYFNYWKISKWHGSTMICQIQQQQYSSALKSLPPMAG